MIKEKSTIQKIKEIQHNTRDDGNINLPSPPPPPSAPVCVGGGKGHGEREVVQLLQHITG